MALVCEPQSIPDVILVTPSVISDARGFFFEVFKEDAYAAAGIREHFVQINHSRSARGTIRGLHFQAPPHAQAKLVRVLAGSIFDAAVDIRAGSPWFGSWVGVELNAQSRRLLYIPSGFAHGFSVLSEYAEVEYLCSSSYDPLSERGIRYNDPAIAIDWHIDHPLLSAKDSVLATLAEITTPFTYRKTK